MKGSHNTFTYLQPLSWWMRILTPIARCQKRLPKDTELFDIRVRAKGGMFYVSHGAVLYCQLHTAINIMRRTCEKPTCRVLLEGRFTIAELELLEWVMTQLSGDIKFVCGRHKNGWGKLLTSLPDLDVEQYVGSMQTWYGKLCPWLWWKLNRKKLQALKLESDKNYLFDFV